MLTPHQTDQAPTQPRQPATPGTLRKVATFATEAVWRVRAVLELRPNRKRLISAPETRRSPIRKRG